jgi:hypothetical protein
MSEVIKGLTIWTRTVWRKWGKDSVDEELRDWRELCGQPPIASNKLGGSRPPVDSDVGDIADIVGELTIT